MQWSSAGPSHEYQDLRRLHPRALHLWIQPALDRKCYTICGWLNRGFGTREYGGQGCQSAPISERGKSKKSPPLWKPKEEDVSGQVGSGWGVRTSRARGCKGPRKAPSLGKGRRGSQAVLLKMPSADPPQAAHRPGPQRE